MRRVLLILIIALFTTLLSCVKDEEHAQPIADFTYEDKIDRYVLIDKSVDAAGNGLTSTWEILGGDITLYDSTHPYFLLPHCNSDTTLMVKLTVTDGVAISSVTKPLPLPKTTWYRVYGIGANISTSVANDVSYHWYIDQYFTGEYWFNNCGPASVTMALKWEFPSFTKTAEDARNTYLNGGGWWYVSDIANYLNLYHARGKVVDLNTEQDLVTELDLGRIAILCLDIHYVRTETKGEEWPLDKFYTTDAPNTGHFIVVKGYKKVDNSLFFEVYDPWSLNKKYVNRTFMGMDRLYRSEDIMYATGVWWKYAFILYQSANLASSQAWGAKAKTFDMTNIPDQKGR